MMTTGNQAFDEAVEKRNRLIAEQRADLEWIKRTSHDDRTRPTSAEPRGS